MGSQLRASLPWWFWFAVFGGFAGGGLAAFANLTLLGRLFARGARLNMFERGMAPIVYFARYGQYRSRELDRIAFSVWIGSLVAVICILALNFLL